MLAELVEYINHYFRHGNYGMLNNTIIYTGGGGGAGGREGGGNCIKITMAVTD